MEEIKIGDKVITLNPHDEEFLGFWERRSYTNWIGIPTVVVGVYASKPVTHGPPDKNWLLLSSEDENDIVRQGLRAYWPTRFVQKIG